MADQSTSKGRNVGKVIEIKGVVIDAVFPDSLPVDLHARSRSPCRRTASATLVAEVQQHLGDDRVRAVAMDSTDGLARGVDVIDTGAADLGARRRRDARTRLERARRAGRQQGRAARDTERWSIHRDPPPFDELSPKIEIFETGLKVDRPDRAVHPRRQGRPLRRRRRRQDRADPGADPQRRARARRRLGVRRRRRAHARGQRPAARDDRVRACSTRSRSSTAR